MNSVAMRWNGLEPAKKVTMGLGVVALLTTLFVLGRMATQPSMALLYSGLEAPQAGDVVRALEQRGEAYEIKGGTIYVAYQRRDELRMTLASEGLPANSTKGYELLDSLSGFGTTSQMFDAAYLRAKEGELARTIVSSAQIAMARVHIAQNKSSAFERNKAGSASVFITPAGAGIDQAQAKALRYLVASAIAGVSPENVSIVDEKGGLIGVLDAPDIGNTSDTLSTTLKSKVERLLEARVGAGNAIVELNVETVLQREQITERVIDPDSRVIISSDNEERSDAAEGSGNNSVTVASNLPDGEAGGKESTKSNANETRERINYEVSETQREIVKAPGAVKRLSVAVLVNGIEDPAAPGVFAPRAEDELAQLTTLVRSAIGFDEARGDVISVQSMAFSPQVPQGTGPVTEPLFNFALDLMTLLQMAILAIVGIVIALMVVRPILKASNDVQLPALAPPALDNSNGGTNASVLSGEIDFGLAPETARTINGEGALISANQRDQHETAAIDNPIQRLREMIDTRQEETVDILRQWLEHKEQANS
ncbi:MAG: flagellar basal-body MS-ring/collar protein FliF [Planktotalea sp.]|uniref:flagellar basal-body MS-ring/collar protein FliF n=1 Tax=Planktotalea sp. TaxID=2029877 RepID=UPI003C78A2E8